MTRQRKAATGQHREAAQINYLRAQFTKSADHVKAEFIRLVIWLQIAGGLS